MKRFLFTVLSLFVALIQLRAQAPRTNIQGTVTDSAGKPLPLATVSLVRGKAPLKTTATDAKGAFRFAAIDTGAYTIAISHAGYTPQQKAVHTGDNTPLSFSLSPAPAPCRASP